MEAASRWNIGRIGQYIAEPDIGHAKTRIWCQDAGKQRARIGMVWCPEESIALILLDEAAEIHDGNLCGDVLDDGEVMTNEKIC